jgi:hypothetical protein
MIHRKNLTKFADMVFDLEMQRFQNSSQRNRVSLLQLQYLKTEICSTNTIKFQCPKPLPSTPSNYGGPDAGTSLPPLQPMERPAENALERGGESDGMESGQMPTRANL